jgi:hypothetical protein
LTWRRMVSSKVSISNLKALIFMRISLILLFHGCLGPNLTLS